MTRKSGTALFTAALPGCGDVSRFAGAQAATLIDFEGDKNASPYVEDGLSFAPNRIVNGNFRSVAGLTSTATDRSYLGLRPPSAGEPVHAQ